MKLNWDALGGLAMMIAFALAAFAPIPAWGRAAGIVAALAIAWALGEKAERRNDRKDRR